jgi:hypothetical protein
MDADRLIPPSPILNAINNGTQVKVKAERQSERRTKKIKKWANESFE